MGGTAPGGSSPEGIPDRISPKADLEEGLQVEEVLRVSTVLRVRGPRS